MIDNTDAEKWDARYSKNEFAFFPPCKVLHQNRHLLPLTGSALELASGIGRNAVALARHGLSTIAMDISNVALNKLAEYAVQESLNIKTQACDLNSTQLPQHQFDVIVVSHYLNRDIIADIKSSLKVNGLIFYQTFIKAKTEDIGPGNPEYLLGENELLNLFKDFKLVLYREEGTVGDTHQGFRNEAMLIAQKSEP